MIKILIASCLASYLCFCVYTSISIFVKNNQKEFDLDYFVLEYKTYCGTIDLKYESYGRTSSSCYVVIDNNELRVSRLYYNSHRIGDYDCIKHHYAEPNGHAVIGIMAITFILIITINLLVEWLYK